MFVPVHYIVLITSLSLSEVPSTHRPLYSLTSVAEAFPSHAEERKPLSFSYSISKEIYLAKTTSFISSFPRQVEEDSPPSH